MLRIPAGGFRLVSPKRCRRSLLPGVWGCPPIICHCEPFPERSEAKAQQSPLPEMATSPLAAGAPRHDRIGKSGGQGVEEELYIVSMTVREVQDTSCRGFGGVPHFSLPTPKTGGQGVDKWLPGQHRHHPPDSTASHWEVPDFYSVPGPGHDIPDARGKQPC